MTALSTVLETPATRLLREKLSGLESVFDAAPVGLCVMDLAFRYVTVNLCFARMYGLPQSHFIGKTVAEALPVPAQQILLHLRDALASGGIVEREIVLPNPSKEITGNTSDEVIYLRTAQPIFDEDRIAVGISVALLDLTQRKQVSAALKESEENLRYTVELTPHLPWTADISGELTFMSARWNTLIGNPEGAVFFRDWAAVLHPDDLPGTSAIWLHSVETGEPYDAEYRIKSAAGGWRWVRARAYPRRDRDGTIVRWYGTVEDVHDRKGITVQLAAANALLARRAHEDHLTSLPNRRQFDAVLAREVKRARRMKLPIAVVLLDIDYFKRYNDVAGHLAGDECLKTVARTIESVIRRPGDLAARFGGEEFALILPDTSVEGAREITRRAVAAVHDLVMEHPDPKVQQVTISAGLAIHPGGLNGRTADKLKLLTVADAALYEAKAAGRDCFRSQVL